MCKSVIEADQGLFIKVEFTTENLTDLSKEALSNL